MKCPPDLLAGETRVPFCSAAVSWALARLGAARVPVQVLRAVCVLTAPPPGVLSHSVSGPTIEGHCDRSPVFPSRLSLAMLKEAVALWKGFTEMRGAHPDYREGLKLSQKPGGGALGGVSPSVAVHRGTVSTESAGSNRSVNPPVLRAAPWRGPHGSPRASGLWLPTEPRSARLCPGSGFTPHMTSEPAAPG